MKRYTYITVLGTTDKKWGEEGTLHIFEKILV